MLRFEVYSDGSPVEDIDLAGAYVFGQDTIPVRADLAAADGQISCVKRVPGACGLALLWEAKGSGEFLLATTRLPERNNPYNLNVELARSQMMRLSQKIEDWGLFDFPEAKALCDEFDTLRLKFIECLKTVGAEAANRADLLLGEAVTLGEKMALFHAEIFLSRRKSAGVIAPRSGFGMTVDLQSSASAEYQEALKDACDFLSLPTPWKHLEPKEREYQYAQNDAWIHWAAANKKFIHAGPLVSFNPSTLPEWLYLWEHDYETLRDLIYEHVQQVVRRYDKQVWMWNVVSGIHAQNNFNLSFEQLMELTRMSCLLVKKLAPRSQAMIELAMPWGEYYSRNLRTIPPMLYADMAVQSGVKFDAFGVQIFMGVPTDGYYVRDLMQISSMLDEFVTLGKPLHITACQVPSETTADGLDAWEGKFSPEQAGWWHAPWTPRLQAEWLQAFYRIAISKPFVESVTWRDLADCEGHFLPHGGLCKSNMEPKLGYKELKNFRGKILQAVLEAQQQQRKTAAKKN